MNEYIEQIAKMLVDSADVPTDESDVADEVSIVQTAKFALDKLTTVSDAATAQRDTIDNLSARLDECRGMNRAAQTEIERLNNQIQNGNTGANELQDRYNDAWLQIGALTEQLSAAKRTAKRWEDEAANSQARYEGMEAALRIVLELAGVGK